MRERLKKCSVCKINSDECVEMCTDKGEVRQSVREHWFVRCASGHNEYVMTYGDQGEIAGESKVALIYVV